MASMVQRGVALSASTSSRAHSLAKILKEECSRAGATVEREKRKAEAAASDYAVNGIFMAQWLCLD